MNAVCESSTWKLMDVMDYSHWAMGRDILQSCLAYMCAVPSLFTFITFIGSVLALFSMRVDPLEQSFASWRPSCLKIKDFPQPAYKKFGTKEEAEEYVKVRRPERVSLEVDEKAEKFYAVARGKVVGIFTDYNEVKNHIADYPQPMYKKFEKLDEAQAYYHKYSSGADGGGGDGAEDGTEKDGNSKESKPHSTTANNNEKEVKEAEKTDEKKESDNKKHGFYAVARGHKTGVFKTWEECQEATRDFKGAKFKKFDNEDDAKLFAEGKAVKDIEDRKRPHDPDDAADGVEEKSAKKETKANA